jgi:uncharacterized phage protein (TIGR02218 family)
VKDVPPEMIQLILTQHRFAIAELYTFTLNDGAADYFTSIDLDLNLNSHTYKANALRIEGLQYNLGVGFKVDELTVKISAFPGEQLAGAEFFTAVQSGLLDGATIQRDRVFWAAGQQVAYRDYLEQPVAIIPLFLGFVSTIDRMGRTFCEMKVKSPMSLLDIDMPRNTYQQGCLWTLYEPGCGAVRADFTSTYTVGVASPQDINPTTAISPVTGADGVPYYALGRLKFTSGPLINVQVAIESNDGTTFGLAYPLAQLPNPGDTFEASAGCTKMGRGGACELKFNRLVSFRGFPKVPPVVVAA